MKLPKAVKFEKSTDKGLPVRALNLGRNNSTITRARVRAIAEIRIDSPRNCFMSWKRLAPTTFRNPTSLVRWTDRAVARFIKLIQAVMRIKNAMSVKKTTYWMSPSLFSNLNSECKCIAGNGCKKNFILLCAASGLFFSNKCLNSVFIFSDTAWYEAPLFKRT